MAGPDPLDNCIGWPGFGRVDMVAVRQGESAGAKAESGFGGTQ